MVDIFSGDDGGLDDIRSQIASIRVGALFSSPEGFALDVLERRSTISVPDATRSNVGLVAEPRVDLEAEEFCGDA